MVQLVYGKEVGDGKRFAVVLGGLRYRIVPRGPGLWEVTEVIGVQTVFVPSTGNFLLDLRGLEKPSR